ncbi:MAG: hypothetical protein WCL53_05140 [Chloroflexota bacterium]
MTRFGIFTDADACIPQALLDELGILTAPLEPAPYDEDESAQQLRREAAPLDAAGALHTLARATSLFPSMLYIGAGDGFGGSPEIRAAVEAVSTMSPMRRELRLHDSAAALMGCGWQAVAAARAGADLDAAVAAAESVRQSVRVIAYLEHPQFAGVDTTLSSQIIGGKAIVALQGDQIERLDIPPKRDIGLVKLRELLARETREGAGAMHLAVHHAGSAAAAGALAEWARRNLEPVEVVLAPLSRHATMRLGPRMVGVAWYRESA